MTIMILSGVLGFLLASLIAWFLAPFLWRRAVRVTTKRLIQQSPRMIDEGHADRDQMRAEFAVTTRKMEVKLEQLKEVSDTQLIELSKAEKKRTRLQGKIESLQTTLQKHEEKIEKQDLKLERLLADIGKKSQQLTAQGERLTRQTEMLNSQAATLEANSYELDTRKAKIADYANQETEFSIIVSRQDLELSQLRSKQREIKLSRKTQVTARQNLIEKLNGEIRGSQQRISELTKDLEARKTTTLHLRQEIGKNKEKIHNLIRKISTKDEKIRQLLDGFPATKKSGNLSTANRIETRQTPLAATALEVNRVDNDNRLSPPVQPAAPAPSLTDVTVDVGRGNHTGNTLQSTPNTQSNLQSQSRQPARSTPPSKGKNQAQDVPESLSLAERIRALQAEHPKSM